MKRFLLILWLIGFTIYAVCNPVAPIAFGYDAQTWTCEWDTYTWYRLDHTFRVYSPTGTNVTDVIVFYKDITVNTERDTTYTNKCTIDEWILQKMKDLLEYKTNWCVDTSEIVRLSHLLQTVEQVPNTVAKKTRKEKEYCLVIPYNQFILPMTWVGVRRELEE